jgi:hypothetical protein
VTSLFELKHRKGLLAACGDGWAYLLDDRLQVVSQKQIHSGAIRSAGYDSARRQLVTGGEDYRLKVSGAGLE